MDIKVVDDMLAQISIVDVIRNYIPLKKAGSNYKALCPFHDEKTPSFNVSEKIQIFKCFGCGVSGNAVTFVRDYEKISFWEAVRKVAALSGYTLPESNFDKKKRSKFDLVYQIYELAKGYYKDNLKRHGEFAQKYLEKRGLSPEICEKFEFGLALDSFGGLSNYLLKNNIDKDILRETGLFGNNERGSFDLFRNRLMIPIHSSSGRVVAFGGRKLDESQPGGKYINSPTTLIYSKSKELYGLNITKYDISKQGSVLVSEGYLDMLRLYEQGFTNSVASLGTALTEQQISLLGRYAQKFYIIYDGDDAGVRAALKAASEVVRHGFMGLIVVLPEDEDPDSFLKKEGKEALQNLIENAQSLTEFVRNEERLGLSLNKKVSFLLDTAQDISNDTDRSIFLKGLSESFNISYPAIVSKYKNKIIFKDTNNSLDYLDDRKYPEESQLLRILLEHRELCDEVNKELDASFFLREDYKAIFEVLMEQNTNISQVSSYQMLVSPEVWTTMSGIMLLEVPQVELKEIIKDVKWRKYQLDLAKIDNRIEKEGWEQELWERKEELQLRLRELEGRKAQILLY